MTAPPEHHTHAADRPDTEAGIERFLERAAQTVGRRGQKLTPIRTQVLRLLLQADKPAKAYDLLDQIGDAGAQKPPTIYRALDFLREHGYAHKIESLNAYVACGHSSHAHSAVFLICDSCGRAEELHAVDTAAALEREAKTVGFLPSQSVLEVHGRCGNAACAAARKGGPS